MNTLEQIKKYMDDNNITQKYLAKKMNISIATPCYWFKGKRSPSLKDVEKMINVLGLEIIIRENNKA